MKRLLALLGGMLVAYLWLTDAPVELGPGILAPDAPVQTRIDDPAPFPVGDYRITPLAEFSITAKVLGKETYRFDREADLAPVDLALGWGRMSDETVLKAIDIRQSGRWYHWRTERFPIPRREIENHSANMHLIPGDDRVADALRTVRPGEIVSLSGKLVRVDADDGWHWVSSLTRSDTGARACELVYVERIKTKI